METYTLRYYNPNALLIINQNGKLRVLYTPFRVLCIVAIGRIPLNTSVYVEKVLSNSFDELQYVIYNDEYSYRHFKVPIAF